MERSKLGKALAGLGAAALLGYLVVWAGVALIPELQISFFTPVRGTFGLCALLAVYSGFGLILLRHPVHSALALVANFFFLAIIYLLLQAVLLAVLQVLVYAGAIMVLFLFVIMFFYQPKQQLVGRTPIQKQGAVASVLGLAFLAVLVIAIHQGAGQTTVRSGPAQQVEQRQGLGYLFGEAVLPNQQNTQVPVEPGQRQALELLRQEDLETESQRREVPFVFGGQVRAIGIQLYTDYLVPFELASVLILVALVAAVVMAQDRARFLEHGTEEFDEFHDLGLPESGEREEIEASGEDSPEPTESDKPNSESEGQEQQ